MRKLLLLVWLLSSPAIAKYFVIAVEDDFYPFSGVVNKNIYRAEGLSIDIIKAVYTAAGHTVRVQTMPFKKCVTQTAAGAFVGCLNMSDAPIRVKDFTFPRNAFIPLACSIYTLNTSKVNFIRMSELKGKRVSVTEEYEYDDTFDNDLSIIKIVAPTDAESATNVVTGKAEFAALCDIPYTFVVKVNPELKGKLKKVGDIEEVITPITIGFSRRHPDAQEALDAYDKGFEIIKKNGIYNQIVENWK